MNRYEALTILSDDIHTANVSAGWWHDPMLADTADFCVPNNLKHHLMMKYVVPTKLALVASEVTEALEGYRKGLMDDKIPTRTAIEVELADVLIRVFDLAGALNLDLGSAVLEKLNFNAHRPDHKPENRFAPGGKSV